MTSLLLSLCLSVFLGESGVSIDISVLFRDIPSHSLYQYGVSFSSVYNSFLSVL